MVLIVFLPAVVGLMMIAPVRSAVAGPMLCHLAALNASGVVIAVVHIHSSPAWITRSSSS